MRMFEDISPRWKQAAKGASKPLTILSPYITEDVALNVLKGKKGARIFTLFEPEVFAAGGSSLASIRALLKDHQVFRLDGLHAKVVTDNDSFITLGSQNLTKGGLYNRELSVHLKDEPARRQAMEIIEPWLENPRPIKLEMINDMEAGIERLKGLLKEFNDQCAKHQANVEAKEKVRANRERDDVLAKSRAEISVKLERALRAGVKKTAQVMRKDAYSAPFLRVDKGESLLEWRRNRGSDVQLEKGKRYLCFLESCEFGWARLAGKQITRIEMNIRCAPGTFSAFPTLTVELSASPDDLIGQPAGTNLVVNLYDGKTPVCIVPVSFQLDTVTAFTPKRPKPSVKPTRANSPPRKPAARSPLTTPVIKWIAENPQAFEQLVRKRVTKSFNFGKGDKLAGENAADFFGETGSQFDVGLAIIEGNRVLHVSQRED
ncbi:hypothetical protein C1886_24735 [Pseudomonas sp. FW300-N1A1]|uniref:hypothetical protein n=1 Tax=Pseudomonas sp. FW300-N1A1 TaxID=2075555 RepID=UPI000CD1013F|nr:hypothetical protein [Pseudomonas sp. FW300-N1A1]POA16915.1 hypothetical protein C1886_24735 [Pseudomonas sp. FW300-N1A1]